MDEVTAIWAWCVTHKENITFGIALLAFFQPLAPLGLLLRHWATGPKLVFGLEQGSSDEQVVVQIANVGARAATLRVRWTARSGMQMEHVPQPAMILPGESLRVRLSIDRLNLLAHGMGFSSSTASQSDPLGWLDIQHEDQRFGPKLRLGKSILLVPGSDYTVVSSSVTLDKLPRRRWKEKVRPLGWLLEPLDRRRKQKEAEQRAREDAEIFQHAQETLRENGIEIASAPDGDEGRTTRLLGELGRRGWEWEYGPGGAGYEVVARKTWFPSSSMTIRRTGETPSEALILALGRAIQEDESQGTTPGHYPSPMRDRDPLNFPPTDPRHDMDF